MMAGEWVSQGGYDWYIKDADVSTTVASVLIGYGLVDEGVAELGTLSLLRKALRLALARPMRLESGRVVYVGVEVEVFPAWTKIDLFGELDTVEAAMGRLGHLFDSGDLDGSADVLGVGEPQLAGWVEDRVARTGLNAWSLQGKQIRCPDPSSHLNGLVRRMSPAQGQRRCVLAINTPLLVGAGLTPLGPGSLPTAPWRPAVDASKGTIVTHIPSGDLFSVTAPNGGHSIAAFDLLLEHVRTVFRDEGINKEPVFRLTNLGTQELLEVNLPPGVAPRGNVLHRLLSRLACVDTSVSDYQMGLSLARGKEWMGPLYEPLCRLFDTPVHVDLAADEVRLVYDDLAHSMHLISRPGAPVVDHFPLITPELPVPRRRRGTAAWRSVGRPEDSCDYFYAPSEVVIDEGVLAAFSSHEALASKRAPILVDLDHLSVLASSEKTGTYVMVDEAGRLGAVTPALLRKGERLETALSQVWQGRELSEFVAEEGLRRGVTEASERERSARTGVRVLVAILAVLILAGGSFLLHRTLTAYRPVSVAARLGETIELPSGATVTVRDLAVDNYDSGPHYKVWVDFCAGREMSVSNHQPWAFREIGYTDFSLEPAEGGASESALSVPQDPLLHQRVPDGKCVSGRILFLPSQKMDNVVVKMETLTGDRLTWSTS